MIADDLARLSCERELSHARMVATIVNTIRSATDDDGNVTKRIEITLKCGQKLTCVPPTRRAFRSYEPDATAQYKIRVDDIVVTIIKTEEHRAADETVNSVFPVDQIAFVEVTSRIDTTDYQT